MIYRQFFTLAVATFFISCGDIERDNPNDPGSSKYRGYQIISTPAVEPSSSSAAVSSSSAVPGSSSTMLSSSAVVPSSGSSSSSSSAMPSSSSVVPISSSAAVSSSSVAMPSGCAGFANGTEREHYGKMKTQFCDPRDGKKYVYVTIGTQTWMAENLNFNASGSKCYAEGQSGVSTDSIAKNCATYGRLYDIATARSVCPSGWHLPSQAEWKTQKGYVWSAQCCEDCDAKHLKATSRWNNSGNGLDTYGFSALPNGYGYYYPNGSFHDVGNEGDWWCADDDDGNGGTHGYWMRMSYDYDNVHTPNGSGYKLYSVRCVKDESNSSSGCPNAVTGSNTVTCGGETYPTVVIGTQTWMAKNLNYIANGSKCYNDDPANCGTYGRLYNWYTAMVLPGNCDLNGNSSCESQIDTKHRGICPSNWHIPSYEDWRALITAVGDESTAGKYLKATILWNDYEGKSGNGTDDFGFSALPGGGYNWDGNSVIDVGNGGIWWISRTSPGSAFYLSISNRFERAYIDYKIRTSLSSVRCLKD